jgi:hypothetical protein
MKFSISQKLLNSVVNYLGSRPYLEVNGLINSIVEELKASGAVVNQTTQSVPVGSNSSTTEDASNATQEAPAA